MAEPVPQTYADAGVDLTGADDAVRRLAPHARSTFRPEVLSDIGSFGALTRVPSGYEEPVLVSATDGAGTKTLVADTLGRYDTIGIDVVAMCVDDIVCLGAEPLLFLDLITVGRLDGDHIEALVAGVASGCRQAGCALVGGEIAEHPDALGAEQWDIGGFAVGVVERRAVIDGPRHVAAGDAVVGLASTGLRCNGYSLARRLLLDDPAWHEELLRPSVIYAPAVLDLVRNADVHAVAHITGGGLPGNLCRVLPSSVDAVLLQGSWDVPPVFAEIQRRGDVADDEMAAVFNLGIGMTVVVPAATADAAVARLAGHGHTASVIGEVVEGAGVVRFA